MVSCPSTTPLRPEWIHPLLVHFPLALLITGTALRFLALRLGKKVSWAFLLPASRLILVLGVVMAWAAVMAGEVARDIVLSALCNPSVLKEHRLFAYLAACGFTLGTILDLLAAHVKMAKSSAKLLVVIALVLLLISFTFLLTAGSLGADLVYGQGAAVSK